MALAGGMTATIVVPDGAAPAKFLFGEDQGCYVVTLAGNQRAFVDRAERAGIPINRLGTVLAPDATFLSLMVLCGDRDVYIPLADLRAAHESFFPKLMGSELTPEF